MVDSELHRPTLHRIFGFASPTGGVSTLLANTHGPQSLLLGTSVPGLRLLPSGPTLASPADLLGSSRMQEIIDDLKAECDILLLDSPPIIASADPAILASKVDGVVMVVNTGGTRTDAFYDAVQQIQKAGVPILGYIMNKVKTPRFGYGRYSYRYYYQYYHSRSNNKEPATNGDGFHSRQGVKPSFLGRTRRRVK